MKKYCSSNLCKRFISSLVILTIFVIAIFVYRPFFSVLMYLISAVILLEWYKMTSGSLFYNILGLIFIPCSMASILLISYLDYNGILLFSFFCLIWSVDVMAMIGGKTIGGIKLAPKISPNKTVSGLIVGVFSATIVVTSIRYFFSFHFPYSYLLTTNFIMLSSIFLGFLAQASDLFISIFKRKFNIKDTGALIPGHGGVLDRFDGFILTSPFIALYFIFILI